VPQRPATPAVFPEVQALAGNSPGGGTPRRCDLCPAIVGFARATFVEPADLASRAPTDNWCDGSNVLWRRDLPAAAQPRKEGGGPSRRMASRLACDLLGRCPFGEPFTPIVSCGLRSKVWAWVRQ